MSTPTTEAARILTGKGRHRRGKAPGPASTPRPAPKPAPAPSPGPAASKTAGPRQKAKGATRGGGSAPKFTLPGKGGDMHRLVVAEFILCVVLIGASPLIVRKPDDKGKLYQPNDFVRLTAVSLLFFVLALSSNGPKGARVSAAFGALVTLGVVYNTRQTWAGVGAIFLNQQQTQGNVGTAAAGTADITVPGYHPITDLGQGDPSTQASGTALSPGAQGGGAVNA